MKNSLQETESDGIDVRLIQYNSLIENHYMPEMPSLEQVTQMNDSQVYTMLCEIPLSIYKGDTVENLSEQINRNDAMRYLGELVLLNSKYKLQLSSVSEAGYSLESS